MHHATTAVNTTPRIYHCISFCWISYARVQQRHRHRRHVCRRLAAAAHACTVVTPGKLSLTVIF